MTSYYPVFLNLKGKLCVVIGGGLVAERKIQGLLECGARVTLVSPQATEGLRERATRGEIVWIRRSHALGDLRGAFLAIAATDQALVNEAIAEEARQERVLLNVVDNPPLCTFIAPSVVKRGEVTVAISTGGASPALARKLREGLEQSPLWDYAELAPLLSRARKQVRAQGLEVSAERWQQCINGELVALVRAGKESQALAVLIGGLSAKDEAVA